MNKNELLSNIENRSAEEKYHLKVTIDIEEIGAAETLLSPDVEKHLAAMLNVSKELDKPEYLWDVQLIDGSTLYEAHIHTEGELASWDEFTQTGNTEPDTFIHVSNYNDVHCKIRWQRVYSVEPSVRSMKKLVMYWGFEYEEPGVLSNRYKDYLLRVYDDHFIVARYDENDMYLTRLDRFEPDDCKNDLLGYFPSRIVSAAVSLQKMLAQGGDRDVE